MARVHCSFTMNVPPDRAQDMFARDIVPDLHKDGEFGVRSDQNGRLELIEGFEMGAPLDLTDLADPDVAGHPEEDDEPAVTAVTDPDPGHIILAGRWAGLRRDPFHHLAVTFISEGQGTNVTIEGHAPEPIRDGLQRLGTAGHWPETADRPHD